MERVKSSVDIKHVKVIAQEAGRAIYDIYKQDEWTVSAKGDSSPLTQADLTAHEIIVEGLQRCTNEIIISEEDVTPSTLSGGTFWLVDPLDGTRDFVARKDTFAVCIARLENFEPVLGVIHAPVSGETWWAERGGGAWMCESNHSPARRIANTRRETSHLVAAGSRSMPSERMQMFYDHFAVKEIVRLGSAIKFCRIAEGLFDLYPRFGPTSEWDTAAAQIILEEADCKLIDIATRKPLVYGKPGFLNRGFVASRADLDIVGELHTRGLVKPKV